MEVRYIDSMGSDLEVVNCARVSFAKDSEWDFVDGRERLKKQDENLIKYLARGCRSGDWEKIIEELRTAGWDQEDFEEDQQEAREELESLISYIKKMPRHWVPFANGGTVLMHFSVPVFVARQLVKHQAGFEPWSEISRRYITDGFRFYIPDGLRTANPDVKQGSKADIVTYGSGPWGLGIMNAAVDYTMTAYEDLLAGGVCPEQARMILPQNMYVDFRWKGNLYAWANLYNTRIDPHAQKEVREVAKEIGLIMENLYPVSWKELTK